MTEDLKQQGPYTVGTLPETRRKARKRYTLIGPTPCEDWWHDHEQAMAHRDALNAAYQAGQQSATPQGISEEDVTIAAINCLGQWADRIKSESLKELELRGRAVLVDHFKFAIRYALSRSPSTGVRPAVQWFAEQMEAALQRNDHKGGWSEMDDYSLYGRAQQELDELKVCVSKYKPKGPRIATSDRIIAECADVANFCMMLADNEGPRIGDKCAGRVQPSSGEARIAELEGALRAFGTERMNCRRRIIDADGSLNRGPTCLSPVPAEYTAPEDYCYVCRANAALSPPK